MPTLDSFFPEGATRGDGRKFVCQGWTNNECFEPIFKDASGYWVGVDEGGEYFITSSLDTDTDWQEYKEPPKTKKVKLYCPIIKRKSQEVYCLGDWASYKHDLTDSSHNIVGWLEQGVEVTE